MYYFAVYLLIFMMNSCIKSIGSQFRFNYEICSNITLHFFFLFFFGKYFCFIIRFENSEISLHDLYWNKSLERKMKKMNKNSIKIVKNILFFIEWIFFVQWFIWHISIMYPWNRIPKQMHEFWKALCVIYP